MVIVKKRLMEYCETCEKLQPETVKIRAQNEDDTTVVVMCQHADICSKAVHQYQKTCERISLPAPCLDCGLNVHTCGGCSDYYKWEAEQSKC